MKTFILFSFIYSGLSALSVFGECVTVVPSSTGLQENPTCSEKIAVHLWIHQCAFELKCTVKSYGAIVNEFSFSDFQGGSCAWAGETERRAGKHPEMQWSAPIHHATVQRHVKTYVSMATTWRKQIAHVCGCGLLSQGWKTKGVNSKVSVKRKCDIHLSFSTGVFK